MTVQLEKIELALPQFILRADTNLLAHATGISGPSGAGKTTLLELVAGLRRPQRGRILLGDEVVTDASSRVSMPPEKRRVGYVPQELALFPHLTVRQNLFFGRPSASAPAMDSGKVLDLLEIRPLLDRGVQAISGGERQRVALGRALLAGPRLLLLDEPLSSLDTRLKQRILPYLQAIRHEFTLPILYVSHSQEELEILCDEILYMSEGCLSREPVA